MSCSTTLIYIIEYIFHVKYILVLKCNVCRILFLNCGWSVTAAARVFPGAAASNLVSGGPTSQPDYPWQPPAPSLQPCQETWLRSKVGASPPARVLASLFGTRHPLCGSLSSLQLYWRHLPGDGAYFDVCRCRILVRAMLPRSQHICIPIYTFEIEIC